MQPIARSRGVSPIGAYQPATTSASRRSSGSTIRSNHCGSSTLTSVTAIVAASASRIAAFRPRERLPGTTSQ